MAMTQEHKLRLQVTYDRLVDTITDIDRITDGLYAARVLTPSLKDRVKEKKGRNQIREMLDILRNRPDEAFDTFYNLLVEYEEDVAADLLCPERAEERIQSKASQAQASSVAGLSTGLAMVSLGSTLTDATGAAGDQTDEPGFDVLPDVWPPAELPDVEELFQGLDDVPVAVQTKYKDTFQKASESETGVYPMCKEMRGRCLIINNLKFHDETKNRIGSEADEKGVKELFKKLHFDVHVEPNRNAAQMLKIMEDQGKFDHSEYQCFVCFVFTHGEEDGLHGVDGEVAPIRDFISAVDCESLKGKPKVFFIQACQRGSSERDGQGSDDIVIVKSDGADPEGATVEFDGPTGIMKAMKHCGADFYITCATVPECLSYRVRPRADRRKKDFLGSWFIQAVVHVFAKYSHKRDLKNMMTMVHALVRKSEGRNGKNRYVYQVSNSQDTLAKVLYFFPGLVKA